MGYRSLRDCVEDLEQNNMLVRVVEPVDPNLEIADIQLKVNEAGGPALLFENIREHHFKLYQISMELRKGLNIYFVTPCIKLKESCL